ncbi:MAG: protein-L-isoaspartate O-methyltransferase, partial [Minisyncoccia bacterium]
VKKYNFVEKGIAKFYLGDGSLGLIEEAPFDKILCSASVDSKEILNNWLKQLKEKGRIVTSFFDEILVVNKNKGKIIEKSFPGFSFVPLVREK